MATEIVTLFTKSGAQFRQIRRRADQHKPMHESGLAEGIIAALRKVQAERGAPITTARLQVGELSGISPEHLAEHFYEAAEGTEFEHVKLETEVRGIMARCATCDAVFEVADDTEACPECTSESVSVQVDDAVKLVSVE